MDEEDAKMPRWALVSAGVFVIAALIWFDTAGRGAGEFDIAKAFAGLGYLCAIALMVLLIFAASNFLRGGAPPRRASRADGSEQAIIRAQLWIGATMIMVGAMLSLVFGVLLEESGEVSLAIGTAVIGAGAAMLPPGAAAGAGERARAALPAASQQNPGRSGSAGAAPGQAGNETPSSS